MNVFVLMYKKWNQSLVVRALDPLSRYTSFKATDWLQD